MAAMAENCAFNFSELEHVRYMLSPVRLSVVRNVRAPYTQAVQIFGNISTALGTLAIR